MSKFYVLEKVAAHKQGRRSEYTRLIGRVHAPNAEAALDAAKAEYDVDAEKVTVQRANGGYDEGK